MDGELIAIGEIRELLTDSEADHAAKRLAIHRERLEERMADEVSCKDIEAGVVAWTTHRGPYDEIAPAYTR